MHCSIHVIYVTWYCISPAVNIIPGGHATRDSCRLEHSGVNSHHPDAYDINIINIMWIAHTRFWHESWKVKIIQRPKSDRNQLPRCQPYPFRTKVNRARVVPRCRSAQMESLYTWVSPGTYLAERIHRTILILYTLYSVQAIYFPSHISPPCLFEGPCRCTSYIPRTAWLYADLSGIQGTNIRELVSFSVGMWLARLGF